MAQGLNQIHRELLTIPNVNWTHLNDSVAQRYFQINTLMMKAVDNILTTCSYRRPPIENNKWMFSSTDDEATDPTFEFVTGYSTPQEVRLSFANIGVHKMTTQLRLWILQICIHDKWKDRATTGTAIVAAAADLLASHQF